MSASWTNRPAPPAAGTLADGSFVFLSPAECLMLSLCLQEREDRDPLHVGLLRALLAGGEGPIDPGGAIEAAA